MRSYIILDSEYIFKGIAKGPRPDVKTKICDVLQFSATKIRGGKEIAHFDKFCLPELHPIEESKDWCRFTEITGITREMILSEGIKYKTAIDEFVEFVGESDVYIMAGDEYVHRNYHDVLQLRWPFTKPFKIVRPMVEELLGKRENSPYYSSELYKLCGLNRDQLGELLGVDIVGDAHNGLFDARSMAGWLIHNKLLLDSQ